MVMKMVKFKTQLLTDETKEKYGKFEEVVDFANKEEQLYLRAMTIAAEQGDMERRSELVNAFNDSVRSYAYHHGFNA